MISTERLLPRLTFVAMVFAAPVLGADTVRAKLSVSPSVPLGGTVSFERAAGPAPEIVTSQLASDAPEIEVPPGTYIVRVAAAGWWMAPRLVSIHYDQTIDLALRRTATVEGELAADPQVPGLVVRFEDPRDAATSGEVACPIANGSFQCEIPEGQLDLRLGANGYVPHYRWAVPVSRATRASVGTLGLVRGASISGQVRIDDDGALRGTRLSLSRAAGNGADIAITPTERGFFLAGPVAPGDYILTAMQKGFASSPRAVTILEGHEAKLRDPVVLSKPRTLSVAVTPPLHPYGGPWVLRLARRDEQGMPGVPVAEGSASVDGSWRAENLTRGEYELAIRPYGAPVWVVEQVMVADALTWKQVSIQSARFRGTVRLGERPLAARVIFGGEFASNALQFEANEDGEFKGYAPIPADGRWQITIQGDEPTVSVTLDDVQGKSDPATGVVSFDLRLPATGIEGEVVDPDGKPSGRAIVSVSRDGPGGERSQIRVDENGRFAFHGLQAGRYRISATAYLADAPVATVEIAESATKPSFVRVQLGRTRKWTGTVTTTEGRPIPGARIDALPVDVEAEFAWDGQSDRDGRFTVLIPGQSKLADVRVAAHGFTFSTSRRVVSDEPLHLVIDPRGATLVVDYDARPGFEPFVWHNGVASPVEALANEWRGEAEIVSAGRRRVRILQLEPGEYTVCLLPSHAFNHTVSVPDASCTPVYLAPFGTQIVRLAAH